MDNVNNPAHYADSCSIECIEAMILAYGEKAVYNFCKCNAWKYLWRYKNKNGKEDLEKAYWYLKKGEDLYVKMKGKPSEDILRLSELLAEHRAKILD